MVSSFSIILKRYELNEEEIDIIKNMIGKNSSKMNVEHALSFTEIFLDKNMLHIRE
jgi:hypothetical protein